ncbi:flagellar protein FliS [Acidisoma sp. C75]
MSIVTAYRSSMFDGAADVDWLRSGWRALRLYGHKAKTAIEEDDLLLKAEMISRADKLLTVMTGIVDMSPGSLLGQSLSRIYNALRLALLEANITNQSNPLDDFDAALRTLDSEFSKLSGAGAHPS